MHQPWSKQPIPVPSRRATSPPGRLNQLLRPPCPARFVSSRAWIVLVLAAAVPPCAHAQRGGPGRGALGGPWRGGAGLGLPRGGWPIWSDAGWRTHFALREFDHFLDHHPLIEEDLRRDPTRLDSPEYLHRAPELRDFLADNPGVTPSLRLETRHFLHRALQRQAIAPLHRTDVAQLDPLLDHQPEIERALQENPARIHDAAFLASHPELRDFLAAHALLARAFPLPPSQPVAPAAPGNAGTAKPADKPESAEPPSVRH